MVLRGNWANPDPVLVLASCKHHAGQHDPTLLRCQQHDFLGDLGGEEGERMRILPRERVLVSPELNPERRG